MVLTEKGRQALDYIQEYFPENEFCAKDLSEASEIKIAPATLTALAKRGCLEKIGGSPVKFKFNNNFNDDSEEKSSGATNISLHKAKKMKNDEFYTQYQDIEAEVLNYKKQFQDKIVYLPCDSIKSEFWKFFTNNFETFGLKELIATHYEENGQAYKIWTNDGINISQEKLIGNGDFRSPECIEIFKRCDIVCTNPPFSLFREFVNVIMTHNKLCLIIGNQNAFTYKEIFPLIKNNKLWTGYHMVKNFYQPDGSSKKFGNVCWFTNMSINKRTEELILTKTYNPIDYPKYDNYDAIEVNKVANIPKDYYGIMGVPITFLDKYNPEQFEILGDSRYHDGSDAANDINFVNGKQKYKRVLIRQLTK